jgi:hypothetical protein
MPRNSGGGFGRGARRGLGGGYGPVGDCVCPNCGYKERHLRGVPCFQKKCPKCETPLVRY